MIRFLITTDAVLICYQVRFDAQGRPEGCIGRGGIYSVGPTPTSPHPSSPLVFVANAAALPRRRPRVGPGRPQGTNPRGLSIPWLACVDSFA